MMARHEQTLSCDRSWCSYQRIKHPQVVACDEHIALLVVHLDLPLPVLERLQQSANLQVQFVVRRQPDQLHPSSLGELHLWRGHSGQCRPATQWAGFSFYRSHPLWILFLCLLRLGRRWHHVLCRGSRHHSSFGADWATLHDSCCWSKQVLSGQFIKECACNSLRRVHLRTEHLQDPALIGYLKHGLGASIGKLISRGKCLPPHAHSASHGSLQQGHGVDLWAAVNRHPVMQ
mmetsp:Transcript_31746/g.91212  ORF Transcript_31746/g.91212 Transcript_31746/m.91212 type:complete len:232 (+) Transcript_31746:352-1047(+)